MTEDALTDDENAIFPAKRGRKAQPPNPDDGPLADFAHQLWLLKQRAGDPSFAVMREELGAAASRSSLAAAARGSVLPTWETTWEFVRALAVERLAEAPEETQRDWLARWTNARDAIAPDVAQPGNGPAPGENGPAPVESDPAETVPTRPRKRLKIIAGLVGVAGLAGAAGFSLNAQSSPIEVRVWQATIVGTWSEKYQQYLGVFRFRSPDVSGDTDKSTYLEATTVSIVCQSRHRRVVSDPTAGNSSAVWDKLNDGYWIPDLYTNLPKVAGDAPPLGIPVC